MSMNKKSKVGEDESDNEREEKKNDSDDEIEGGEEEGEEEEGEEEEDEEDMLYGGEEDEMEEQNNKTKISGDEIEVIDDFSENNYDSEENSDIEDDDNILQKFNDNIDTKFLENIHTETKSVNYDEMIALARVVRDKTGKIVDPLHKTLPFLTKYEKARIIGARAEQLDRGGEAFIPIDETIINGRTIALMEFEAKKIPFIISRPLSNGSVEYWHLRDLEII